VFQFGSSIVADMINNVPKDKIDTIALSEVSAINRPGCLKMHLNEKWVDTQNHNIKMKDEIDEEFNNVLKEINED
jgi:DNA polymerase III alpha subunit